MARGTARATCGFRALTIRKRIFTSSAPAIRRLRIRIRKSRDGDNLYTCSIVAVNVDTGKMAWYYQVNPHDTHDWDSTETPILVDGDFNGRPRKMVLHADRNGYFFTLDRLTGEHLVTSKFSNAANWAKGVNAKGQPVRDPAKDSTVPGSLVSPNNGGATNWPPPAYSPDTGLFYVPTQESYAMYYLTETDPRGAMGLGGKEEVGAGHARRLPDRDRLQDRQDGLEPSLSRNRRRPWQRNADHGRQAAVRGRCGRQYRGLRSGERKASVAYAARQRFERA